MSTEIIKVLDAISERLGVAIDWTTENIMPYLEQLLKRYATLKITYSCIGIFVGLVACVAAIIICTKLHKGHKEISTTSKDTVCWKTTHYTTLSNEISLTGVGQGMVTTTVILAIISIIAVCVGVHNLIEWIIIPEVSFVREMMSLIYLGTAA